MVPRFWYVRRKVDDGFSRRLIHTIRGVGYELSGRLATPVTTQLRPEAAQGYEDGLPAPEPAQPLSLTPARCG